MHVVTFLLGIRKVIQALHIYPDNIKNNISISHIIPNIIHENLFHKNKNKTIINNQCDSQEYYLLILKNIFNFNSQYYNYFPEYSFLSTANSLL